MSDLRAGVGRSNITPPVGILHGNWGAQSHSRASGVHLPLLATALVLSDGETGVVIVDLDLGVVTVDDATAMRRRVSEVTGYPPENVRISYTHTHAGPTLEPPNERDPDTPGKPGDELVPGYRTTVIDQVAGAVHAAMADMRSCRMAAAYGQCDISVNRRFRAPDDRVVVSQNPDGFTDPTVLVARIDDMDETPIASLVGYGAHPIILAFQNSLISPDYPGVTKQVVEHFTGAPSLFLQGCAGNQMTVEALTGDTAVTHKMGTILGAEAARVLTGLRTRKVAPRWAGVVESGAPLGMREDDFEDDDALDLRVATKTLRLPLRDLPDAATAREKANELVATATRLARDDSSTPADRVAANFQAKRAKMLARWSEWGQGNSYLETELHGTGIGSIGLVGFPGEPFAEIGAAIREASPFAFTQFAGYSNGWLGYVPTPEEFPDGGYEVEWGSAFSEKAAPMLESGALELLAELANS